MKIYRQHRIYPKQNKQKIKIPSQIRVSKYIQLPFAGHTESSCQRFPVSQIQVRQCEHYVIFSSLFSKEAE